MRDLFQKIIGYCTVITYLAISTVGFSSEEKQQLLFKNQCNNDNYAENSLNGIMGICDLEKFIKGFDKNNDGWVSEREYVVPYLKAIEKTRYKPEKEKNDNFGDVNYNPTEVAMKYVEDNFINLFSKYDCNNDSVVDKKDDLNKDNKITQEDLILFSNKKKD